MSKKWETVECATCGKTFQKRACWAKRTKNHFCSCRCNGIQRGKEWAAHGHKGRAGWTDASHASYQEKMSGENNPAWKGGVTYKRNKGNYIGPKYVRCPPEFAEMARKDGYVMEHRLVMAIHLGRVLKRVEVVHHKDHNTRNNKIENLELFPNNKAHKIAEGKRAKSAAA